MEATPPVHFLCRHTGTPSATLHISDPQWQSQGTRELQPGAARSEAFPTSWGRGTNKGGCANGPSGSSAPGPAEEGKQKGSLGSGLPALGSEKQNCTHLLSWLGRRKPRRARAKDGCAHTARPSSS